jgi:hypothetical protein
MASTSDAVAAAVKLHTFLSCLCCYCFRYVAQQGDVVVGRVTVIQGDKWKVDLNSQQEASQLVTGTDLVGGAQVGVGQRGGGGGGLMIS